MLDEITHVPQKVDNKLSDGSSLMQRGDAQPLVSVEKSMFRMKAN